MKQHYFKEGEEVAHIGNLSLKLWVERILWKTRMTPTGKILANGDFEKKEQKKIDGIETWYWKENGEGMKERIYHRFHTQQLVPWGIALQGEEKAKEWLENNLREDIKSR